MNKDNHNLNDEKLVSKIHDVLDDSVNRIDADTCQHLITARKKALDKTPKRFGLPKLFAATATAFSILIAVVIVNTQFNQAIETENTQEIELVATHDTTELYEELEFYAWLVEEDITS